MKAKILAALVYFSSLSVHAASEGDIHLTIEGVRSDKGRVLISVFDKAEGFPDQPRKSARVARAAAKPEPMTKKFRGLNPGDYAVAFIHDENNNRKLDKDANGVPVEGFGFSNNPPLKEGAATFDQSKFTLKASAREVKAKMIYLDTK